MLFYDFEKIESKWQLHWHIKKTFRTTHDLTKKKFYCLDMFPYPSSDGLHVGHIEGYTASDIVNRFKRMQGYNVLHPFGWDSFGLPAEQYALKTGNNPKEFTYTNIEKFKKQIKKLGKGIDWDRELSTSEPSFYKWTQWIFKKLFQKKLAFLKNVEVNFCPHLGTVLANEEIVRTEKGLVSERGHFPVEKKQMKQWVLKITSYADRLLNDLELLNWPTQLKEMQKNWIGKKQGFIFEFFLLNYSSQKISVFTTKPSTFFGISALILSPEHPLIPIITLKEFQKDVDNYFQKTRMKTDLERIINKKKTGVFTGSYAVHPFTQKKIPIWIADYVLSHYGTGAVMLVPFCDERDFEFSQKYHLEVIPIFKSFVSQNDCDIESNLEQNSFDLDNGFFVNSFFLNGLNNEEAHKKIVSTAQKKHWGRFHYTYQLRDWVFSRQRYWGEPFPIYYDENNNIYLEKDQNLPIELPILKKIEISGDGTSPLSKAHSWLYFEKDGKKYRRDSNTMPQWAGSSWYYIAYILKNSLSFSSLNSKEVKKDLDYFLPVDLYIGGTEHAVLHLLYSRFWHKFLYDLGLVSCKEPFQKLFNQGMILDKYNQKMSKSKSDSVVNASLVLEKYGADTIRLYIMFLGPLEDNKIWSEKNIKGIQRFLNRIYYLFSSYIVEENCFFLKDFLDETIAIVTKDYENLKFNKVISNLMIFINKVYKNKKINKKQARIFLQLLNPIAPHLTEELNQRFLNSNDELVYSEWPSYNKKVLLKKQFEIIIQINGKLRAKLLVNNDEKKDIVLDKILQIPKINLFLKNQKILKVIYIPNKIINLVI